MSEGKSKVQAACASVKSTGSIDESDLGLVCALFTGPRNVDELKKQTRIQCLDESDGRVTEALCVLGVFSSLFEHKATGSSAMLTNVSAVGQYAKCLDMSGKTQVSWFLMTDRKIKPSVAYRVEWTSLLMYHFDETHGHLVINGIDTRTIPTDKIEK